MKASQPCPCCQTPVTFWKLMFTLSPRFLRCANPDCNSRLTFGRFDLWAWGTSILGGLIAISLIPVYLAMPADLFVAVMVPTVFIIVLIPYVLGAFYVLNYVDLRPRDGCPEFVLPPLD